MSMWVRSIEFDADEEPEFVTFRMDARVALYLAKLVGKESDVTAESLVPGLGREANHAAWEGLTGGFVNKMWEGGIDEALGDTS